MADAPLRDIAAIFTALGGTSGAAKVIGVGQSTASEMKRRGSIPVRHWDRIIGHKDAHGRTITLEDLHEVHREIAPPAAAEAAQ